MPVALCMPCLRAAVDDARTAAPHALLITPILQVVERVQTALPRASGTCDGSSSSLRTARSRSSVATWLVGEARCDGPLRGRGINEGIEDPESLIQPTVLAPP
jgi:hypothetical protein